VTAALDHVLRHNAWANRTLLEFCAALDPADLELSAAGTYGTLRGTLQHIVGGEQWYIWLLTGEDLGPLAGERHTRTLAELMTTSALTGARAIAIAEADDVDRTIAIDGKPRAATVGILLAQLVNHGNEHRGQAMTILGANGRATPIISGWRYGIANGISTHDGDD
jgi:uncharacterized damage-inducible protein DinB